MTPIAPLLSAALALLVLVAAAFDIRRAIIPNWVVVSGFAAGLVLNVYLHGLPGLRSAGLGFAVGLATLLPLFLLRGMGGGDVKLMAAIGTITGPGNCFMIFIFTAVFGGAMGLGLLVWKGGFGRAIANAVAIVRDLLRLRAPYAANPELDISHPKSIRLPYAVPIATATLLFLWLSAIW